MQRTHIILSFEFHPRLYSLIHNYVCTFKAVRSNDVCGNVITDSACQPSVALSCKNTLSRILQANWLLMNVPIRLSKPLKTLRIKTDSNWLSQLNLLPKTFLDSSSCLSPCQTQTTDFVTLQTWIRTWTRTNVRRTVTWIWGYLS